MTKADDALEIIKAVARDITLQAMTGRLLKPVALGSAKSGHYKHAGVKGQKGGSAPGTVGLSIALLLKQTRYSRRTCYARTRTVVQAANRRCKRVCAWTGTGTWRNLFLKEGASTKGSFGSVRIHMDIEQGQLKASPELEGLGRYDIDDALSNEQGAVTIGFVSLKDNLNRGI